jgi:hypothetical protein
VGISLRDGELTPPQYLDVIGELLRALDLEQCGAAEHSCLFHQAFKAVVNEIRTDVEEDQQEREQRKSDEQQNRDGTDQYV